MVGQGRGSARRRFAVPDRPSCRERRRISPPHLIHELLRYLIIAPRKLGWRTRVRRANYFGNECFHTMHMNENVSSAKHRRSPRRPSGFDPGAALDDAIMVFSERGYHATSISDLSKATTLTAGSLYKAFGDKRGIF